MRPIFFIFIFPLGLLSCINIEEKVVDDNSADSLKNSEIGKGLVDNSNQSKVDIKFPIITSLKNPNKSIQDTLIATIDKTDFLITPKGKIFWGHNPADTVWLKTELFVERAFLYKTADTLFVFYTESDYEGATSMLEKIDLQLRQSIWQTKIPAFNLGQPYIIGDFVYVTTIGTVGKLDLKNGDYIYQVLDLYDHQRFSFNSFDTIIFKDGLTIFLSENRNRKRIDSLILNEENGCKLIRK